MTLNFGDEKVTKLYYGDKDVSGNRMLDGGTILYLGAASKDIYLKNALPDLSNIKGISLWPISSLQTGSDADFTYWDMQETITTEQLLSGNVTVTDEVQHHLVAGLVQTSTGYHLSLVWQSTQYSNLIIVKAEQSV